MTSALRSIFDRPDSSTPADQQRRYVAAFLEALPETQLVAWSKGSAVPPGSFLLVGVMVGWNHYDQQLAIALDEAVAAGNTGVDIVAVVSTDEMTSVEELRSVFPGISGVGQGPYLAWWQDGRLRFVESGPSAASWLADRYGLQLP
jgi:hypothetical protein